MGGPLDGMRPSVLSTRGCTCLTCDAESSGASQLSPEIFSPAGRDPFPETVPRWACPRRSGVITWAVLLTLPSVGFMLILVQAGAVQLALATLCVYLCATTFIALAAFSDPGTIAPNRDPDIRRAVQLSVPVEVTIRGVRLQLKHCATCGIHRPPRAVHCRETNRCVRKWDHYCPWLGNSVGEANYAFFLLFVASALALSVLVATGSVLHVRQLAAASAAGPGAGLAGAGWVETATSGLAVAGRDSVATSRQSASPSIGAWLVAAGRSPLSCALLALCTLSTALLTLLLAYHVYLISTNQTTYENVSCQAIIPCCAIGELCLPVGALAEEHTWVPLPSRRQARAHNALRRPPSCPRWS